MPRLIIVLATIKNSWLSENPNYEYFLAIDIVGASNAFKLHGSQFVSVQDTVIFDSDGEISLGDYRMDNRQRSAMSSMRSYTVSIQVVRYDKQQDIFENIGEQTGSSNYGPF